MFPQSESRPRPRATIGVRVGHIVAAALCASALAGCGAGGGAGGAGGGGGGGISPGLPGQSGCFYQYTPTEPPALVGNDPLLASQWHLNNVGQSGGVAGEDLRALAAWAVTRGEGARVAVVDDAVDTLHQDLAPNVVAGASYGYRPGAVASPYPLPCAIDDDHGTAVAAIALARDGNAAGGAGVAPRASLVAYSALATSFDADLADALTRGLDANGVYQNSWGSPDDGRLGPAPAAIRAAIDAGIATARGGRGAIYVFPAGNGGCYAVDFLGNCLSETAGLDGYLNHRGVIAVCAVDHAGRKPRYAETGANLLVCAPSSNDARTVAITTAAPKDGYRSDFSGTSASTPMVSGVVALMLAANPALTWRDARLILAHSARRNDAADPGWVASPFGPPFNHKYGFGVADAQAAVALARSWTSVGGASAMRSCGPYRRTLAVALPDASGSLVSPREDTIAVGADCAVTRIEYVEVEFTATHTYSGDLRIELISPNGLASELAHERICDGGGDACGAYDGWTFGSVRHLDEPAGGSWRLRVTDAQAADIGTWRGWSLTIRGR